MTKVACGGETSIAISGFIRSLLGEEMREALSHDTFTDVAFYFDENSKENPVKAHRVILAQRCPSLEKLVDDVANKEKTENGKDSGFVYVYVAKTSRPAFQHFLQYLYSDYAPNVRNSNFLEDLIKLAKRFDVPRYEFSF
jgi:hypothetical protein